MSLIAYFFFDITHWHRNLKALFGLSCLEDDLLILEWNEVHVWNSSTLAWQCIEFIVSASGTANYTIATINSLNHHVSDFILASNLHNGIIEANYACFVLIKDEYCALSIVASKTLFS